MGYTLRAATLVALLLNTAVKAHEHHDDKIEEGQVISADPIVRHQRILKADCSANVYPRIRYYGYIS